MEIETVRISQLENWSKNPREVLDLERLKSILMKRGQIMPLILDGRDMKTVLGGNMRLRAMVELGWEECTVSVVHPKDDKDAVEIALEDNDSFGRYIRKQLVALVNEYNIDNRIHVEMRPLSIRDVMPELTKKPGDDNVPAVAVSISKLGDIYELNGHRVYCGSSTDPQAYEKLLGSEKADILLTDPPYNVNYESNKGKIKNDNLGKKFRQFITDWMSQVSGKVKGGVYIFMSPKELGLVKEVAEAHDFHWHQTLVWVKDRFTLSGSDYQHQYEPCLYGWFSKDQKYFTWIRNNSDVMETVLPIIKKESDNVWDITFSGFRLQITGDVKKAVISKGGLACDILRYDRPMKSDEHPTMKPTVLCEHLITRSTQENDIVMDTFLGSGSTLIAAEKSKRRCYEIELDEHYCDVIVNRWCEFTGQSEIVRNGKKINWKDLINAGKE